jgi:excisionase family DNA binding protein
MALLYDLSELLSVLQAAKALDVSKWTIYRWAEEKTINGVKIAGHLFIPKSEVERFQKQKDSRGESPLPAQGV